MEEKALTNIASGDGKIKADASKDDIMSYLNVFSFKKTITISTTTTTTTTTTAAPVLSEAEIKAAYTASVEANAKE
jgi:hypothetical protein